ncbi:MAG: hypothetical protein NWF07_04575 [Candidatus Bathyarchaeota archaeon]|nr:hypothetical protein [Candidatus Bathyarchaeota archaeon]
MTSSKRLFLITVLIITSLTSMIQVAAFQYDDVWFIDAEYPETVEAGGVLELEVTVGYNFTTPARLNVWVYDGFWYSYDSEIVTDVYIDVNEPSPEIVSLQVPAPDEEGEYIFNAEVGWCDTGSTELNPILGMNNRLNVTFTVTPATTVDTGSDTTNNETGTSGGIPGFPTASVGIGLLIVLTYNMIHSRKSHPTGKPI